jgi:septal ring factor EnvC (AmiA/AmiB activator)
MRRCAATVLLCLAAGSCLAGDAAHADRLENLQQRIGDLQETIEQTRGRKQGLLQELERAEKAIGAIAVILRDLDRDIAERSETLQRLQSEQASRSEKLAGQRAELSRQLRDAYGFGRQERLKLLLNQEDPGRISRILAYQAYLSRHRAQSIRAMGDRIAELLAVESEVRRERAELELKRSRQRNEKHRLQATRAERDQLLRELDRDLSDQGRRLERLRDDEKTLRQLIARLERKAARDEAAQRESMGKRRGKLSWPVSGRVAARFGTARAPGGLKWDGMVLDAGAGAEVRAVHHGRVAFADWLRGFGLLVILDHGEGYMSLYGFNQSLLKEAGEWVEQGEPIALVGDSGGRSQSGLYFGIRKAGKPQNPRRWCAGKPG